jgi:hypothetical protein
MVFASLRERTTPYAGVVRDLGLVRRGRRGSYRRFSRSLFPVLLLSFALGLTACGSKEKQDENEEEGTWKVQVVSASFPGKQILADTSELQIKVKNVDSRALPNLAVTVDGFSRDEDKDVAEPKRPIWVIEEPPDNSTTAFTNTWAVGPVPAGEERTLKWKVTAVRAGTFSLRFRVSAGLDGKAKAELSDGGPAVGSFVAQVSEKARPFKLD